MHKNKEHNPAFLINKNILERKKKDKTTLFLIKKAALEKGIVNPHQLHLVVENISYPRMVKIWKDQIGLTPQEIDAICVGLNCELKNLIVRVTNRKYQKMVVELEEFYKRYEEPEERGEIISKIKTAIPIEPEVSAEKTAARQSKAADAETQL